MNFKDFKSGRFIQQYQYKSFLPTLINHVWIWDDPKINILLEEATRVLGELNAFSLIVPDVDLFIQMHITKEANTSTRIEGSQTQMDEALRSKEQIPPEKRDDWSEVQNYVKAMNVAIQELERFPLSNRLLAKTHDILLSGVRGQHKAPGEFRKTQNWIGGASLQDAAYIPPTGEEVPELMSDLEKFWHNEAIDVPHLIRVAISHYQFETIHPFLDGNGRLGRLLITLYLVSKELLAKPCLYLSSHLERHKGAYFDALTRTRLTNDIAHWVRFFLVAIAETAKRGKTTFIGIMKLREESEQQILTLGKKAPLARDFLNILYRNPFITPNETAKHLKITHQTASSLLMSCEKLKLLKETTGNSRNRQFVFDRYYKLFLD